MMFGSEDDVLSRLLFKEVDVQHDTKSPLVAAKDGRYGTGWN